MWRMSLARLVVVEGPDAGRAFELPLRKDEPFGNTPQTLTDGLLTVLEQAGDIHVDSLAQRKKNGDHAPAPCPNGAPGEPKPVG